MADKKYKEEIQITTLPHDKSSGKTLWNLVRVYEGENLKEQTLYRVEGTSSQKVTNPAFVSDSEYSEFMARSKLGSNSVTRDYINALFKGNTIVPGARIFYFQETGNNGDASYKIKKSGVIERVSAVKRTELSDKVDFEDFVLDVIGIPDNDFSPYNPAEEDLPVIKPIKVVGKGPKSK